VRVPYSFDWFDWDFGLGIMSAGAVEQNDFFNTGQPTNTGTAKNQDVFVSVAGNLQFGRWGFGLAVEGQTYALRTPEDDRLGTSFTTIRLQVARAFLEHQLIIGAGPRFIDLQVDRPNPPEGEGPTLLAVTNVAAEVGALWKPNDQPYRLGLAFRSPILVDASEAPPVPPNAAGDYVYGDPASPDSIFLSRSPALPWDLHVGGAVQFGPRPLNPRWPDPAEAARPFDDRSEPWSVRRSDFGTSAAPRTSRWRGSTSS
jgi:hypothetical protein